ncbi:DUF6470 family protein [Alkalicoccus daliensis]|uniref:YviE n=1 Tax=Alkalicoccus daliensis TaxID=745820 RepID=A0A1H0J189_9BACI|nr:DUF6470 family protein [Alkalicoccus daliensis]SDO37362.1 hypothetical protein SAMN04488053_11229 [Alkalicoccus daliensis]
MDLPKIQISQTNAKIGMQSHKPQMSIQQRSADMKIHQDLHNNLSMQTTDAEIHIDQSAAFADADVKNILRRNEEFADKANQNVMEYVAKVARDGEQMKRIENPGEVIPRLAEGRGLQPERQFDLRNIPTGMDKVRISHVPAELSIHFDWPAVEIDVQKHQPVSDIPRWEINTYLAQKNQIQFSVAGSSINRQL